MPNGQVDVDNGAPHLESYTQNGDGTVTDLVTGLMWEQPVGMAGGTFTDAMSYCDGLSLAGHSDWHLPTRIELVSIIDFGFGGTSGVAMSGVP